MATKIMAVGDSITAQADPYSYLTPSYDALRSKYDVQFVGRTNGTAPIFHEGVPGATLVDLEADIAAALAANPPDIVTVLAGTNDIIGGASGATAESRLRTLLNSIRAGAPAAGLLVLSPIPYRIGTTAAPGLYHAFAAPLSDYHSRIPAAVASYPNARYVNVFDGYNQAWFSDDIHQEANGGYFIHVRYVQGLRPLLPALPGQLVTQAWTYQRSY